LIVGFIDEKNKDFLMVSSLCTIFPQFGSYFPKYIGAASHQKVILVTEIYGSFLIVKKRLYHCII